MIEIAHPNIETKIILKESSPVILVIENPHEFFNTVCELSSAFLGEESKFSFWEHMEEVKIEKVGEIIVNCFSIDFSDKKIINLLYKKLQQNYFDGDFIVKFNEINTDSEKFLQDVFSTVDFSLDYDELNFENFLKVYSVKPKKTYETFLEKIVCYINIFIELKNVKVFAFVNLKSVLTDDDLIDLYHHCELQKVSLILLESSVKREFLKNERAIIITEDLCEIIANFS